MEDIEACREKAAQLLDKRAHTRHELAGKLQQRDFQNNVIQSILDDFEATGILDDAGFAVAFVREKSSGTAPKGAQALRNELLKRGVSEDDISTAFKALAEEKGEDWETSLAQRAAETKLRQLSADPGAEFDYRRLSSKLARHLINRGFSSETVWNVVKEVLGEPEDHA